jgi:hypothetical protein
MVSGPASSTASFVYWIRSANQLVVQAWYPGRRCLRILTWKYFGLQWFGAGGANDPKTTLDPVRHRSVSHVEASDNLC